MGKKIWIFNHYARPPEMSGGTRHFDFSRELVKQGHQVTIFASSFIHEKKYEVLPWYQIAKTIEYEGVRFVWIRTIPYKGNGIDRLLNMLSFTVLASIVSLFHGKVDLVVGSSVHLFTCLGAHLASVAKKCPYVSEIRDLWPQTLIDMGVLDPSSIPTRLFAFLERHVYRISQKIIILLPDAKAYIERMGIPSDKLVYIPNGVAVDRFNRSKPVRVDEAVISRYDALTKNFFVCIYAGAHGPANALENIIDASDRVISKGYKNIRVIFVGDGPEKLKLMQRASEKEWIEFFDPVPKATVQWMMGSAGACIFNLKDVDTFKYGISPNKLFDYMLSGRPILFACNASNDIIKESGAGISVPPGDPEALSQAIISLYEDSETNRSLMGLKGMNYVLENHNIQVLSSRFEKEIIEKL